MEKQLLGNSGLEVSTLGLGCMGLTAGDLRELDSAAAQIIGRGERYPESSQKLIDR